MTSNADMTSGGRDRAEAEDGASEVRINLDFDLDRLTWIIFAVALLLAVTQVLLGLTRFTGFRFQLTPLLAFFDTNGDLAFNAWFGSLVFATGAVAAGFASRGFERRERHGFIALAILLFYLSLDKAVAFHDVVVPKILDVSSTIWLVVGLALVTLALAYAIVFTMRLSVSVRLGLQLGGAMVLLGSVVFDLLGDALTEATRWRPDPLSVLEELAEIAGVIILIRTCFLVIEYGPAGFSAGQVFRPASLFRRVV